MGGGRVMLKEGGKVVELMKTQLECGREKVGKEGVVRNTQVHLEVIRMVADFARVSGFDLLNLEFSPIKGPEGNIEYLLHLRKNGAGAGTEGEDLLGTDLESVVKAAHGELD